MMRLGNLAVTSACIAATALSGCTLLPAAGPTATAIQAGAEVPEAG
ncbi:hypothetical protein QO016_003905, partial [Methylobacterium persicinum]|nr:hypothetical protein [Methylobacterium persicinum]